VRVSVIEDSLRFLAIPGGSTKNPAGGAGGVWGKLSAAYPIRDGACVTTPTTMTRTATGDTARAANGKRVGVAVIDVAGCGKWLSDDYRRFSGEKQQRNEWGYCLPAQLHP
jgi:hypothetical protein